MQFGWSGASAKFTRLPPVKKRTPTNPVQANWGGVDAGWLTEPEIVYVHAGWWRSGVERLSRAGSRVGHGPIAG